MKSTTNVFLEGLITDLHPLNASQKQLTDALNATFITYNGNEYMLQNDMGNTTILDPLSGAIMGLEPGFVPVGMTEHGGIFYIASFNPKTQDSLLGTIPSPVFNYDYLSPAEIQKTNQYTLLTGYNLSPIDHTVRISDNVFNTGDVFAVELLFNKGGLSNLPVFRRPKIAGGDVSQLNQYEEFNLISSANKEGLMLIRLLAEDVSTNSMFDLNVHNTYRLIDNTDPPHWFYGSVDLTPNSLIENKLESGKCIAYPNMQSGLLHIKPELSTFKNSVELLFNNTSLRREPYYNKESTIVINIIVDNGAEAYVGEDGYEILLTEGQYVIVGNSPLTLCFSSKLSDISVTTSDNVEWGLDSTPLKKGFSSNTTIIIHKSSTPVTPPSDYPQLDLLGVEFYLESATTLYKVLVTSDESSSTSISNVCNTLLATDLNNYDEVFNYSVVPRKTELNWENYEDINNHLNESVEGGCIIYPHDALLLNLTSFNRHSVIDYKVFTADEIKDLKVDVFEADDYYKKTNKYILSLELGQTYKYTVGSNLNPFIQITTGQTLPLFDCSAAFSDITLFNKWEGLDPSGVLTGGLNTNPIKVENVANAPINIKSVYSLTTESNVLNDYTTKFEIEGSLNTEHFYVFNGNLSKEKLLSLLEVKEYDISKLEYTETKEDNGEVITIYYPRYNNIIGTDEDSKSALLDISTDLTISNNKNSLTLPVSGLPLSFISEYLNITLCPPYYMDNNAYEIEGGQYIHQSIYRGVLSTFFSYKHKIYDNIGVCSEFMDNGRYYGGDPLKIEYKASVNAMSSYAYGLHDNGSNCTIVSHFCNNKYLAYIDIIPTNSTDRIRGLFIIKLKGDWNSTKSEIFSKFFAKERGYIIGEGDLNQFIIDHKDILSSEYVFFPVKKFTDKLNTSVSLMMKDLFTSPGEEFYVDDLKLLDDNNNNRKPFISTYLIDFVGPCYLEGKLCLGLYGLRLRSDILGEIVMDEKLGPGIFFGLTGSYTNNVFESNMVLINQYNYNDNTIYTHCYANVYKRGGNGSTVEIDGCGLPDNTYESCFRQYPFGIGVVDPSASSVYYKPVYKVISPNT